MTTEIVFYSCPGTVRAGGWVIDGCWFLPIKKPPLGAVFVPLCFVSYYGGQEAPGAGQRESIVKSKGAKVQPGVVPSK